jgi:hypothetical protein
MYATLRVIVAVVSVLCLVGGLVLIGAGGRAAPSGLWLIGLGAAGLIAVAFERSRYRSEAAERGGDLRGSAGLDDGPPDPRFRATDERFVDPTTRQRLRVWVDPASGERRYRPDE